jgi:hypothetical protein
MLSCSSSGQGVMLLKTACHKAALRSCANLGQHAT